jgi:uncharacterized repeat protein (TIGR03803 family)
MRILQFGNLPGLCVVFSFCWVLAGHAQSLTNLYTFTNGADGGNPAGLIEGTDGSFYGTAVNGGSAGWGSVFRITSAGGLSPLYSFKSGDDGATPTASLTRGTNGLFYGMAEVAGANGSGTIFDVSSNGTFNALYSFAKLKSKSGLLTNADGAAPGSALALGTNGNFYGTAPEGGTNSYGTIFEFTHEGKLTVLHAFSNGADGAYPGAPLLQFTNGNLYGTTVGGGSNGYGTIFQLTAAGVVLPLYSFTNGADGSAPESALIDGHDGNLYGTCTAGGLFGSGTIFRITTAGVLTPLYSFSGASPDAPYYNNDGASPRTLDLGADGNFYGVAYEGGTNGAGGIFQFSQSGGLTPIYSFNYLQFTGEVDVNSDGGKPISLLQSSDGDFYGLAYAGGSSGFGTFFRIGLPPQIAIQPVSQAVSLHGNASFSVAATGALAYQWQFDDVNLPNGTNQSLELTDIQPQNAGYYQVVLTNINGATVSLAASLGITNLPLSFSAGAGAISYTGGAAVIGLTNLAGQGAVVIDASTDLIQWTPISTNPPGFGAIQVIDTDAGAYSNRFYRARTQ